MTNKAVIGLGFGDEGKGLVTNYLALSYPNSLVVRYSGGQQAGHTVIHNGKRHVFSNFGSGTLAGNPTYWSKFCTFDPIGFITERLILKELGITPTIYIDMDCPVTTPFDKHFGGQDTNGTCGVGVGKTKLREENFYSLTFSDLFYSSVLYQKIEAIKNFYNINKDGDKFFDEKLAQFYEYVNLLRKYPVAIQATKNILDERHNSIFESSQGLLLDQHYGFFPNVTRSDVGSPNFLALGIKPEMWLVTRAYQTRHGNGPMTNTDIKHNFNLNKNETNVFNKFQGNFRVSLLDLDLLEYSINKDPYIRENKHNLVVTCLDQIQNDLRLTYKEKIEVFKDTASFIERINSVLKCNNVYLSESEDSTLVAVI